MGAVTKEFDSVRHIDREDYEDGSITYRYNGVVHRQDGPAIIHADGTKMWYRHGERHRENGPAMEFSDGSRHWYQNNQLHRDDGAAIEEPNGTRHWYHHGRLIVLNDEAGYKFLNTAAETRLFARDISS
jgi:hypothetical protein